MDFYSIGALKVFSQLGDLIEEDENNQVNLCDLPNDVMQKIGSYLLEDKNKTIHKIFKDRPDHDLQVLLFGEVKDLTYVNIYDSHNEIDYSMNDKLQGYVNYILKAKGVKSTCEKMRVNFYHHYYKNPNIQEARVIILFCNKKGEEIAAIKKEYHIGGGGYNYILSYRLNPSKEDEIQKEDVIYGEIAEWKKQSIQKKDIIKEYNTIHDDVFQKYFSSSDDSESM
jgi:hypothetical protein